MSCCQNVWLPKYLVVIVMLTHTLLFPEPVFIPTDCYRLTGAWYRLCLDGRRGDAEVNPQRQQVKVGHDIGNMREKAETCRDKTSTWTGSTRTKHRCYRDLQGRDVMNVIFKDEISSWGGSRMRHRCAELPGQKVGNGILKDETAG